MENFDRLSLREPANRIAPITFEELPFDVVHKVCGYLSLSELLQLARKPLTRTITEVVQAHYRRFCRRPINVKSQLWGKEEYALEQFGSHIRKLSVEYSIIDGLTMLSETISTKCKSLKHLEMTVSSKCDYSKIKPVKNLVSIDISHQVLIASTTTPKDCDEWQKSQILPSAGTLQSIAVRYAFCSGVAFMRCTQLRSLTLLQIQGNNSLYYNLLIYLKINQKLTELHIDNTIIEHKGFHFRHLAVNLRNIETLKIESRTKIVGLTTAVASFPRLGHLNVTAEYEGDDFNDLLLQLSAIGSVLKVLHLAVHKDNIVKISQKACMSFRHLTSLHTFSLKGLVACGNDSFYEYLGTLMSLRNLSLKLRTDDYDMYGLGKTSTLIRNVPAISKLIQLDALELVLYACPQIRRPSETNQMVGEELSRLITLLALNNCSIAALHIGVENHVVRLSAEAKRQLGHFKKLVSLKLTFPDSYDPELRIIQRNFRN